MPESFLSHEQVVDMRLAKNTLAFSQVDRNNDVTDDADDDDEDDARRRRGRRGRRVGTRGAR